MKTLTKILYMTLLAIAAYTGIYAQDNTKANAVKLNLGYNALQAGTIIDGNFRARAYTNAAVQDNNLKIGFHGLNEAGKNYLFGRETIRLGTKNIPADLIYTSRVGGEKLSDIKQIDQGIGARLNKLQVDINGTKFVEYGWIDLVKHFGKNYKGLEAVIFAGKSIDNGAIEATAALKEGGQKYLELEALTPTIDIGINLRGYGRIELPEATFDNPTYIVGIQAQL